MEDLMREKKTVKTTKYVKKKQICSCLQKLKLGAYSKSYS